MYCRRFLCSPSICTNRLYVGQESQLRDSRGTDKDTIEDVI